jgi:hypothetical protein
MTEVLRSFVAQMDREGWICPNPAPWNRLWEMLPEKRQIGNGWEPSVPLILAGWAYSTDAQKRERFLTHLAWADDHGAVEAVLKFLESLSQEDWHTQ